MKPGRIQNTVMEEVDEPESYNLKFTAQQGCSYTMQNYIYTYMHRLRKFVIERYYVTNTIHDQSHNDRMCHVHNGFIRLRTLAKQIDHSNTEIYNICKLQCTASFLF